MLLLCLLHDYFCEIFGVKIALIHTQKSKFMMQNMCIFNHNMRGISQEDGTICIFVNSRLNYHLGLSTSKSR